jgi:hypothetical protein
MVKNGNSFCRKIVHKITGHKMVKITKNAKESGEREEKCFIVP